MIKKIIAAFIIGIIIGLGAQAYVYWRHARNNAHATPAAQLTKLEAACSGGTTPVVTVSWFPKTGVFPGVSRQIDGAGSFTPVFAARTSVTGRYSWHDTSVATGHIYRYHVNGSTDTVTIMTSPEACK
jgi:hypothetical protein